MATTSQAQAHARSLYRSVLRELPARHTSQSASATKIRGGRARPSISSTQSPLQISIRSHFAGTESASSQSSSASAQQSQSQTTTQSQASVTESATSPHNLTSSSKTAAYALARRQEAEQFVIFLKAQRMYGALLERYNPGMWMDEEQRIRLTARRVGMEMPEEWYGTGSGSGKK